MTKYRVVKRPLNKNGTAFVFVIERKRDLFEPWVDASSIDKNERYATLEEAISRIEYLKKPWPKPEVVYP